MVWHCLQKIDNRNGELYYWFNQVKVQRFQHNPEFPLEKFCIQLIFSSRHFNLEIISSAENDSQTIKTAENASL